jgi:serine/threonine protein phosphatase PrpC
MEKLSSEIFRMAFHVIQEQGERAFQEDTYSYDEILPNVIWMAVYDGHGGGCVSELAKTVLPQMLKEGLGSIPDTLTVLRGNNGTASSVMVIRETLVSAVLQSRKNPKPTTQHERLAAVVSGSTVSGILRVYNHLFIVNLGDSSTCVMCKDRGILFKTRAHKPSNQHERARIERVGGYVDTGGLFFEMMPYDFFVSPMGPPARVNGMLAMSRALGDWFMEKPRDSTSAAAKNWDYSTYPQPALTTVGNLKMDNWLISKVPDVVHMSLEDNMHDNKPLLALICTDGLTDIRPLSSWAAILTSPAADCDSQPSVDSLDNLAEWNIVRLKSILNSSTMPDNTTVLLVNIVK